MMKDNDDAKAFFSPVYSQAAHDYVCDGCLGEYPIRKGDHIMRLKTMRADGKFETMVLCTRCKLAVQSKYAHNGDGKVEITKGSLKFQMLSSAFKKAWTGMEKQLVELYRGGNLTVELRRSIVTEMIRTVAGDEAVDVERFKRNVEEAVKVRRENRRKLSTMRKAFDETKDKLDALRKRNKAFANAVRFQCDKLATDRLGLMTAKTDEDKEEWKKAFVEDLETMRGLADELAETAMEE